VQELGGSTARQPAQAGQWKYSMPWMLCSVYEWGLVGIFLSLFYGFKSSLVQVFELLQEFGLFP